MKNFSHPSGIKYLKNPQFKYKTTKEQKMAEF